MSYYLSRWYRRAELVFRISLFIAAAPMAGAFGGLIASGILKLPGFGMLHGWRMIFAVEGIVSIFLGIAGLLLLTDRPETANWLKPDERRLVVQRVMSDRPGNVEHLDKVDWVKLRRGFWNPVVLASSFLLFLGSFTAHGLGYFLPAIVDTIFPDKSVVGKQLWTVPPHAVGIILTITISGLSWRLDRRQSILTICSLPILIAYTLVLSTNEKPARYVAAVMVAGFYHLPACLTIAQVSANVLSDTSRSSAISTSTTFAGLAVSLQS